MIPGEQFGAAGLAAQVRGPCPLQTGTAPTVRTPPPLNADKACPPRTDPSRSPTDRPRPPQTGSAHQGHFPASTSDRTFPCLGHTPDSAFSPSWGLGSFGDPFCVFVSLCLCFGSLCHPSIAPQPCQPYRALQLWGRNSLLGPRLSPGYRTVPPS